MNIIKSVKTVTGAVGSKVKEHSPEICLAVGIAGVLAGTVFACKGTIKAKKIMDDTKDDLETIKKSEEVGITYDDDNNEVEYTHQNSMNDRAIVVAQTGVKLLKAYGPAIILTTTGIALLISGNRILRKRNLALVAAYKSISEAYKQYQDKVKDVLGETAARNLKYSLEEEDITTDTGKKNKDGTPKLKKEKKLVFKDKDKIDRISPYARFFDSSCKGWENDPIYNLAFLKNKQAWCNDRLHIERRLCLNDVYEELGIPKTKKGQVVGWSLDNPEGSGVIDFGIFDMAYAPNRDFVNGYEPVCLLDFNVDGPILDFYPDGELDESL